MDRDKKKAIDGIFAKAFSQNRNVLYEHEVYRILSFADIDVPQNVFVKDIDEIDEKKLSSLSSSELIIKIVSRDIVHKQKYGGVKRVVVKDPLFVKFAVGQMKDDFLAHFDKNKKPSIDGFLIVEFIKYSQALGNELMIGLNHDKSFGSVITLTKGGDDAEFFAEYYDPANLSLCPVTKGKAYDITRNTKIRHKYEQSGHFEYLEKIAKAITKLSILGHEYSFMSSTNPDFHLDTMDINPIVFSRDKRFVAIDGYAKIKKAKRNFKYPMDPNTKNLEKFFNPDSVAVFGVSSIPSKHSLAKVIAGLFVELGRDDIYCVNPKGNTATMGDETYTLYKSFNEIPADPDLLVYAAPAKNTLKFLDHVPENKAVILISGFPPETDYNEFLESIEYRKPGIRIIGPNCMGVFNAPSENNPGVNTLFIDESRLKINYSGKSNTALLTQSGAMGITMVERNLNSCILRTIVSYGNKCDVNVPDLMSYFENKSGIDVISIYMEGVDEFEGRLFFESASKSKKPIIVYKSGRTKAGAKAAQSHTASMSGSYDIFKAACDQSGCVLTETLDDFYNFTKAFAMLFSKEVRAPRVAGVVNAGLDATMGADTLYFLEQANLDSETEKKLKELNTHGLVNIGTSFLDVTPMTDDVLFAKFAETVLSDDNVDCLFIAIVPHIENLKTVESDYSDSDAIAVLLSDISKNTKKPIVVSVNSGDHYKHMVAYMEKHGIPVFPNIHAAIRSLDAFVKYKLT